MMKLEKYIKNLKKGLVITAGFVLPSLAMGQSFYGDQVLNPGAQPNVKNGGQFTLDYYGSGDADGNDTLNWNDYILMNSNVQNDRTDINGNGIKTDANDKQLLSNLLNGQIKYLPAHWDLLQTKLERESWLTKTLAIDSTDLIPWTPSFDCTNFAMQTLINFAGIENISNSSMNFNTYDTTKNARFNIPMYYVSTKTTLGGYHSINDVVTGDSVPVFNEHYFIEPQNDSHVVPGNWSMNPNSYANLKRFSYIWSNFWQTFNFSNMTTIDFNLTNGNASVSWQHPNLITTRQLVPINPTATLPGDTLINYNVNINPDPTSIGMVPTNVSPGADWFYSDSTTQVTNGSYEQVNFDIYRTFTLKPWHKYTDTSNTVQKEYPYHWLSTIAGIDTIKIRDIESPFFVSLPSKVTASYGASIAHPNNPVVTDNSNLGVAVNYTDSIAQDPDTTKCEHYQYDVYTDWTATDTSGNVSDTFNISVSVIKPNSIIYTFVPKDTIVNKYADTSITALGSATAQDTLMTGCNVNTTHKDSLVEYTSTYEKWARIWTAENDCNQKQKYIQNITRDLTDEIDEYSQKSFEKLYPNPTKGIINLEGKVRGSEKIHWEVYNLQGKLMDNGTEEVFGKFKENIDLSEFKNGMYFLKFKSGSIIQSFKIVKN